MTLHSQTLDVLCQLLRTGDAADRCYAARALGILRDSAAVELLIERLQDEDIDVAIDAAEALGRIGALEAVPALIESLENDPSGELRAIVAEALGKIGSSEAVAALLEILQERPSELEWDGDWDTWWDIQLEAVKALGAAKAECAIEALVKFIDDDEQQDIENEILSALVNISDKGVARVIERLQSEESRPQRRRRAARALAKSATREAAIALGRALRDKEPEVRAQAARSLAEQNSANYLRALVLMLRDPDEEVRKAAIKAVIQLAEGGANSDDLQDTLQPMLTDPSSEVRATLFNTLLSVVVNNPLCNENFAQVVKSIGDKAAETASSACTLLGANGNPAALAPLLELLNDPGGHPMVRREAALSVGKLGQIDSGVIETLSKTVGDRQQPVRLAALCALMALETAGNHLTEDTETQVQRPLDIIIEAVNGQIQVVAESATLARQAAAGEETGVRDAPASPAADQNDGQLAEFDAEAMNRLAEPSSSAEMHTEPTPVPLAKDLPLPETPARIVREGELAPAMSTLDAIAMENVEQMLHASSSAEEPKHDAVTQEYLGIVEDNKEIMRRMRANRKINADQDVRRLGTRVLAQTDEELAVSALIQALSDEDGLVRREAAEAIGAIALRNRQLPGLVDAVGMLITQLALGDIEQRVTCARTLSYLGHRAALAPLMEAAKAADFTLRVQATESLARLSAGSLEPETVDHMVVRDIPPLSVARKLMEGLDDTEMGVRVAAAKGLAQVLKPLKEETFTRKAVEKIVSSVTTGTGEEARLIGRALRQFDINLGNQTLLAQLQAANDSVKRSVFIEMIEELLNPDQDRPEQAA